MTSEQEEGRREVSAFVDEAWIFRTPPPTTHQHSHWFQQSSGPSSPGLVVLSPEQMPLHSHTVGVIHGHQARPSVYDMGKFDPSFIKKDVLVNMTFDSHDFTTTIKKSLKDKLNREIFDLLDIPQEFNPTNKENTMSERNLRIPENPIEVKDLQSGLRALGMRDSVEILDAVALVQTLTDGERLMQVRELKSQDIGSFVMVVDGHSGYLTDLSTLDDLRNNNGCVKIVLNGKMIDVPQRDFVVVRPADEV